MNKKLMSDFSQWLKTSRKNSGMTLMQLKTAIGDMVSDAYLSKLENDKYKGKKGEPSRPARELVIALAEVFKDDPGRVLHLAGYPSENIPKLPAFLYQIDWQKFGETDIADIKDYLHYKLYRIAAKVPPPLSDGQVLLPKDIETIEEAYAEFSEDEMLMLIESNKKK